SYRRTKCRRELPWRRGKLFASGFRHGLPARLHVFGGVELGIGFGGNRHAQEFAQGLPPILRFENKQTILRNRALHFFVVAEIDVDHVIFVVVLTEGLIPDQDLREVAGRTDALAIGQDHRPLHRGHDGFADAFVPGLGIAQRQDHLGIRVMIRQFLVVFAARPIDARIVAFENLIPVNRFALGQRIPKARLFGMDDDLVHVVGGAETQLLKGILKRRRSGAAVARTNDFERHAFPLKKWRLPMFAQGAASHKQIWLICGAKRGDGSRMVFGKGLLCAALVAGFSVPAMAQMKIESGDIAEGAQMNRAQVRAECRIRGKERGADTSPALAWSGAPSGTKSYAVTMLDPMDDTHYFWHWIAFNIPASVTALPPGASGTEMPQRAVEGVNDYGTKGYGGPCPPRGTTH